MLNVQFPELLAELPAVRVDLGYGVVAEEELLQGAQAVQRAAVHLPQAVVVQVTVEQVQGSVSIHIYIYVILWSTSKSATFLFFLRH